MENEFEHLTLLKNEYELLKLLKNKNQIIAEEDDYLITYRLAEYINWKYDEIGNQIRINDLCKITKNGLRYLNYHKNLFCEKKLPIIISCVAIVLTVINLALQCFGLL